ERVPALPAPLASHVKASDRDRLDLQQAARVGVLQVRDERAYRHALALRLLPAAERHRAGLLLLVADDRDVRHLVELGVADLGVHALVALVDLAAQARGREAVLQG